MRSRDLSNWNTYPSTHYVICKNFKPETSSSFPPFLSIHFNRTQHNVFYNTPFRSTTIFQHKLQLRSFHMSLYIRFFNPYKDLTKLPQTRDEIRADISLLAENKYILQAMSLANICQEKFNQ